MLKLLRSACVCIVLLLTGFSVYAQKTVTGTVSNEKGVTVPGATVKTKDGKQSVTTDVDGKFSIEVPDGVKSLVVSFVGYPAKDVRIGSANSLTITLGTNTSNAPGEVVVIGYGTSNKRDVNGAIASLKADQLRNVPQATVDQMLQGRVAGATVTQNSGAPGGATSIRIRGISSIGSNEPLYVIDGVPLVGDGNNNAINRANDGKGTLGFSWMGQGAGQQTVNPLASLNPNDIASIDILKDASAAAIYGNRASNGVIIITTKRGRAGEGKINYDMYHGVQRPAKYMEVMNLKEYAKFQNDLAPYFAQAPRPEFADISILGEGTNWQKEIFRQAAIQNHQLSFTGGREGVSYFVSGNYFNQDGLVIGSNFNRYSLRANIDGQVKKWLKVGTTLSASRTKERITLNDDPTGAIAQALLASPDQSVYGADGNFYGATDLPGEVPVNPVAKASLLDNTVQRDKIFGNIYAEISFLKDFTARIEFAGDFNTNLSRGFKPTYKVGNYVNSTAQSNVSNASGQYWDAKQFLTYNKTIDKHRITAMFGHEISESSWRGLSGTRNNFLTNDIPLLGSGDPVGAGNYEYQGSQALESYFGRAVYTFDSRYSVTATLRADGSSKFSQAAGNQWGYFPSIGAGWTVSNEKFMEKVKVINNLKLRMSYGEVGNQNIPNYAYGSSLTSFSTGLGVGFIPVNMSNENVSWEKQKQINAGIDLTILKGHIDFSFDYFNKISSDFLTQIPLQGALGTNYGTRFGAFNAPFVNAGEIANVGFDINLKVNKVALGPVEWNSSLVFSHFKNEVNDLRGQIINKNMRGQSGTSKLVTRTQAGVPVGSFFGLKTNGIYRTAAELTGPTFAAGFGTGNNQTNLGDVRYVDINNDGVINDNDRTFIGNPTPDFTYGFTNSFAYKGIELSVFVQGSQGGEILNFIERTTGGLDKLNHNQLKKYVNYWTPTKTDANVPRPRSGVDNLNLTVSDRYVEDGSYLRIQNLSLGYRLPARILKHLKIVNNLKVYASVQNVATFTKYTGLDPEIGSYDQDALLSGVDNGRYPTPRTFTFGVNLEF
jgi:TonB-linked SusC/RagA family outer membrane protein